MKKISILIPCYNEEGNIVPLYNEVINIFAKNLSQYDYEIIFIDNYSTDNTRFLIREICKNDKKAKAIFNTRNFGSSNSLFYGLCQTSGDCAILLYADFQEPIELIPNFITEWENGYKIISAIKNKSKENVLKRFLRTCYYKTIKKMSDVALLEHFDGFGLYDNSFIDVLRNINDPTPFLRGIVAELGFSRKDIMYTQQRRRSGKSHISWYTLYNDAMLSFTSYTKVGLRIASILGFVFSAISFLIALVYFVFKLIYWESFSAGIAPIVVGVFFLGSLQIFFIGLVGEYVMAINTRTLNRPLVIEEERINF
jgi:glycosyltransferase involved in cell wall biosynthesis